MSSRSSGQQLKAANDNVPNVVLMSLMRRCAWDIYRAARRGRWIGRVIATDADDAIVAAAVEFNTDAWKLIAVRRYEPAACLS